MLKANKPKRVSAAARHIAQWRRCTARLQVLVNQTGANDALASEACTLQRQCERLAAELGALANRSSRQARP